MFFQVILKYIISFDYHNNIMSSQAEISFILHEVSTEKTQIPSHKKIWLKN